MGLLSFDWTNICRSFRPRRGRPFAQSRSGRFSFVSILVFFCFLFGFRRRERYAKVKQRLGWTDFQIVTVKAWPFFLNFSQEKEREKREIVAPTVMEHCGTPGMSWKPESSADARKMEIFSLPLLFNFFPRFRLRGSFAISRIVFLAFLFVSSFVTGFPSPNPHRSGQLAECRPLEHPLRSVRPKKPSKTR